ncbi:MAG: Maf family protein, partial [Thermoleophilia bacterium]|nr:Maf family protein [Thermoleophilia bacterium]
MFLASESPRRHSLLREIGVPFTVVASMAREELSGDSPAVLAQDNARAKVEGALIPAEAAAGA